MKTPTKIGRYQTPTAEFRMKAFGQIIKSMFILHYIKQVELRQAIEKQLNKIELANGFTRAVAVGNPNGLEYAEKSDQEIAEGCNRLIRNSIICWKYLYLTQKITLPRFQSKVRHPVLNPVRA